MKVKKIDKDIVLEYISTTKLHPLGVYKLEPLRAILAFLEWYKKQSYEQETE